MSKEIFTLLCCPETKQPVTELDPRTVAKINGLIASGKMKNVSGKFVSERISTALVREDGKIAYQVRNNIPVMLINEGLDIESIES